ncbi:MAG TPA: hypothetical protein VG406_08100 [Isosphaeraceae bacterium]|nr:hypothetical protein [Isosphaeraceae bacterium]
MLTLQLHLMDELADRIERAYLLHGPRWCHNEADAKVWSAAATTLLAAHLRDALVPLDPELFVAAQVTGRPLHDPRAELTGAAAARRYGHRVLAIVRKLRRELRGEVRRAEGRLRRGVPLTTVVAAPSRDISPLGRLIVAHRAGRPDLAEPLRGPAAAQHRSCPLYRAACLRLLPAEAYPDEAGPLESRLPDFSRN